MTEEQKAMEEESLPFFNNVSNKKNYIVGVVAFMIAGLFLLMSLLSLPMLIVSPTKFTLLFTISMIATLVGLAFMNGPQSYLKKLTIKKNRIATGVLLGSILLSLYFSIISGSYLLSLLFCFIQFNAVLLYFFNTFPFGWNAIKSMFTGAWSIVRSQLPN
mmetsp:Transcript_38643/g.37001  ORF Transcript_38643/g.37001 Transcript_38643/m.37001 type:complete len:160 (-) Transcript_38643:52-531(-)